MYDAEVEFEEPIVRVLIIPIDNSISGMVDISRGETVKGTLKVIGMSDNRAKHITGE